MSDIFISYSSKDREQAQLLTELLASAGLSVWIDQAGIGAATSWSEEIVNALDGCKAFIVMLSPSSVESKNVVREIALAFEKNKKILPLDLEPVLLPPSIQYHLAGLQRTSMSNIDAVIRALGKLGLEATGTPKAPKIVKEKSDRKSLMILPFHDLSPTGDNAWFADGIANELISALSSIKSLRVADKQATKDYKRYQGTLPNYAAEMSIRYFIQGDVRKFGDQIKISSSLLDIETGDHLWQDSMKGTMNDIFEIQEKVAESVVEGLKLHLASDERKKLTERGTENAEAYEFCMKGREYFEHRTKEGFERASVAQGEAIRLDPNYAEAYYSKAIAHIQLYRYYDRRQLLLDEAEVLCKEALRLRPDRLAVYDPLSQIYFHRGQLAEAEAAAKELILKAPQSPRGYFSLGFFYSATGQHARAIPEYEEALRLDPDSYTTISNLVASCDSAGEIKKCRHWAAVALPFIARSLRLEPDQEYRRVSYAIMIFMSGNIQAAHLEASKLTNLKDGDSLYNTACLFSKLGDAREALRTLKKSMEAGYKYVDLLKDFLSDEKDGIVALEGTPEYEELKTMVEKLEAEQNANA